MQHLALHMMQCCNVSETLLREGLKMACQTELAAGGMGKFLYRFYPVYFAARQWRVNVGSLNIFGNFSAGEIRPAEKSRPESGRLSNGNWSLTIRPGATPAVG